MMKLRIRSMETKETIRVEAQNSSSLLDLKTLISSKVSSSPPIAPQSISLSLNRKDELAGGDTLQTLGLASGDLVYYSLTSSTQPLTLISDQPRHMEVERKKETPPAPETLTLEKNLASPVPAQDMEIEMKKSYPSTSETLDPPNSETPMSEPDQDMDVEEDEAMKGPRLSVPGFLRRVMELEKQGVKGELGFLVIAVHAVFLESGFVVCHGDGSDRLPKDWISATAIISIEYTLPLLVQQKDAKAAILRFSAMGKFVSVYGFLTGEGSPEEVYRLCLDSAKVAPFLAQSDFDLAGGEKEKEVFNLWKVVKDGLCLPLLISICQKNGLPSPPCFARLPTDLKLMVLELLPGADVARIGCASSELRYLSDTDELWKRKFVEEFGPANEKEAAAVGSWRDKYKKHWARRKECSRNSLRIKNGPLVPWGRRMPRFPLYGSYAPRRFPIIGGDHDLYPPMGDSFPVGMSGFGFPRMSRRQNFSPHCNFGDDSGDSIG